VLPLDRFGAGDDLSEGAHSLCADLAAPQNRHKIAASWISSAQKGHFTMTHFPQGSLTESVIRPLQAHLELRHPELAAPLLALPTSLAPRTFFGLRTQFRQPECLLQHIVFLNGL